MISIYFEAGSNPKFYDKMEDVIELENYHSIRYIKCNDCNLIALPDRLPMALRGLYCCHNHLKTLPELPISLEELYCSNNLLESLPELSQDYFGKDKDNETIDDEEREKYFYSKIRKIVCYNNNLTKLPHLPYTLNYLECFSNKLESLPKLPFGLSHLDVSNNKLTEIPRLPECITRLDVSFNKIRKLPSNFEYSSYILTLKISHTDIILLPDVLPESLEHLDCENTRISFLPRLPDSLKFLECKNTNIKTLPNLPKYIRRFSMEKELKENIIQKFDIKFCD